LKGVDDISFMELTADDVVRHRLIGDIVKAYDHYEETKSAPRSLRNN
jgi:phosphate starvation-inducible PhoH-like protein